MQIIMQILILNTNYFRVKKKMFCGKSEPVEWRHSVSLCYIFKQHLALA